jgi:hypothetical protein
MKTAAAKPDPRAALAGVLAHHRVIYCNVQALRQWRADFRQKILLRAQAAEGAGGQPSWNFQHYISGILPEVDPQFSAVETALLFLENSAEYIAAEKLIAPLLADLAELEKQEAAAALRRADLERQHREAVAAAEDRARAAALRDPEVASAARALAAA